MTIDTIVRASGITTGGREYLQDITTGAMLFLALILQSVVLSHRGSGSFKQMIPKWLKLNVKSVEKDS
jgi:hypothetical protein